jgi:glucose/arabinose dehydrogenase
MRGVARASALLAAILPLTACGKNSELPEQATYGPHPVLPEPSPSLLPILDVAPAKGWTEGMTPKPASGLTVTAYATGLDHPRWLYILPNGDVLVAETDAPPRPEDERGIKGWLTGLIMAMTGARGKSANRITLLRGVGRDGRAEVRRTFIEGLNSPFGMALIGSDFYVANTDAVQRFPYVEGATHIEAQAERITDLPAGTLNHHWTKNLLASPDGRRLYATVGSNSNAAEHGLEREESRAAILEIDPSNGKQRIFASGLRNPNGLARHPETGALWTVVNERDELGSDLVPDYLTKVEDGGFYGWPYSYFGRHVDPRVLPQRPDLVAEAIVPDYALGNHTAALGLAFSERSALPETYRNGAFIGLHGSWNRKPKSGYKVVFVPFVGGRPAGPPIDVLTGFLDEHDRASGRPVGVAMDTTGALLVADDVGNTVWRVTAAAKTAVE